MTTMLRNILAPGLACALALTLTACATTQMTGEWRDPGFTAASIKGKRVLVVCRSSDETLRRICEDQWTAQLTTQGAAPVRSYSFPGFPWASAEASDELKVAVRASGAAVLAATTLSPSDMAIVNAGPQVGFGIGGGSGGYRGGGVSYGGIGISLPIGGASTSQGLGASTSLVDVASGTLVWLGSASTAASGDLAAQVSVLTQTTIEAMRKAGLI